MKKYNTNIANNNPADNAANYADNDPYQLGFVMTLDLTTI